MGTMIALSMSMFPPSTDWKTRSTSLPAAVKKPTCSWSHGRSAARLKSSVLLWTSRTIITPGFADVAPVQARTKYRLPGTTAIRCTMPSPAPRRIMLTVRFAGDRLSVHQISGSPRALQPTGFARDHSVK